MIKLMNQQEQKELFQRMADDLNKIAADNGLSPVEVANMFAQEVGSPVRFK